MAAPHILQQIEPAPVWQVDIQDEQIKVFAGQNTLRLGQRSTQFHLNAVIFQSKPDALSQGGVILQQQNVLHRGPPIRC